MGALTMTLRTVLPPVDPESGQLQPQLEESADIKANKVIFYFDWMMGALTSIHPCSTLPCQVCHTSGVMLRPDEFVDPVPQQTQAGRREIQ
jgi:hypothetical protein